MFSGKRRLFTGLIAASLLATMVTETVQSPAVAKSLENKVATNSKRLQAPRPIMIRLTLDPARVAGR
jgi:hypothetical protein